jgi:hypothetical protein
MTTHTSPCGDVAQSAHVCPTAAHVRSPIVAHVPELQHVLLPHVPSVGAPQLELQLPLTPQVGCDPVHGWHAPPLFPHFALSVPGWQTNPSQQPPEHGWLPTQELVHVCWIGSHAVPAGQSPAPLQPHAGPPPVVTHLSPLGELVQSTH